MILPAGFGRSNMVKLLGTLSQSPTVGILKAAQALDVTPQTLQRWARLGYLKGIAWKTPGKQGQWKFKRDELEDWYKNRT